MTLKALAKGACGPHLGSCLFETAMSLDCHHAPGDGWPMAAFVLHQQSWALGEKVCRPLLDHRASSEEGHWGAL